MDVRERAEKYISLTEKALAVVQIAVSGKLRPVAEDMLDMARRYLSDARYYFEKGDYSTALAAASYAHAWLDVGVRLGLLKGEDTHLFMQG